MLTAIFSSKEIAMKICLLFVFLCVLPPAAMAQTRAGNADPLNALPHDTIVAVVDGEVIRLSDLDSYSQTTDPKKLFQLNQQLYDFRESMLGLMLGERLLALEARAAQTSVDELLAQRLKVEPVTEQEIQEVISRSPEGAVIAPRVAPLVRQYLEDRKWAEARARYVRELIAKARKAPRPLTIHLQPPRQHVAILESDPAKGSGAVNLVEFSDFQCPHCRRLQPVLEEVLGKFDGQVTHVWKDYPLPGHDAALPAAAAARCAHDQGRFWPYHDRLFANQETMSVNDFKQHARSLNLDTQAFDECVDRGTHVDAVASALRAASVYNVPATPTVFINGRIVTGVAPAELYTRIISEELEH
jgi:protein-disulfide isomerase